MTAIPPITSGAAPQALTQTKDISQDFQAFLTMLSAQMRHQDPLNPIEGADYATQLATFSGVEQQVKTNDLLTKLIDAKGSAGLASIAPWIGREVAATGAVEFHGAPISLDIKPAPGSDRTVIEVQTESGRPVQVLPTPQSGGTIDWVGVGPEGHPLPSGRYRFQTVSYQGDTETSRTDTPIYQLVREVRLDNGTPTLVLENGANVNTDSITALRQR